MKATSIKNKYNLNLKREGKYEDAEKHGFS